MAAFPSSTGTKTQTAASAWDSARTTASMLKTKTNALNTASAAGPISSSLILDYATYLADAKSILLLASAVPGIAVYAQEQINDPTFDIAASFNGMMTAINDTIAWVIANFPKDANGFLLARNFTADNSGRTQDRQFTTAQTAGLRTTLTALAATID